MSHHSVDDDRILDLLHGLSSDEERRETLKRLAEDPEAERAFQDRARALERARARGGPRLAPERAGLRERFVRALRHPRPGALVGFGAAVAIFALLLQTPSIDPGGAQPLPSNVETLRLRSAEPFPSTLRDGLDAYTGHDWSRAVTLLEREETSDTAELVRKLYLASALALSDRPADALEVLDGLPIDVLPDPWGSEARWTRAVALREVGRDVEAEAALRELAEEPGDVGERARKLLNR